MVTGVKIHPMSFSRATTVLATALALLAAPATYSQFNEFRSLWVDAWGTSFLNASQPTQLIADCRAYYFNDIVVQMRRRGDAFYKISQFRKRSEDHRDFRRV
jgi:uncharacterized lipoprotein YddW (UPF0748 family)